MKRAHNTFFTRFLSVLWVAAVCAMLVLGLAPGGTGLQAATGEELGWYDLPKPSPFSTTDLSFYDVSAVDGDTAWAIKGKSIFRILGGGLSFMEYRLDDISFSGSNSSLSSVCAIDRDVAWVTTSSRILKTVDGGISWQDQPSGTTNSINELSAVDSMVAWAVGDCGTILKTTDGGTNWEPQVSGTKENLECVSAVNSEVAWVGGGYIATGPTPRTALRTVDGGTTWSLLTTPLVGQDIAVAGVDSETAWFAVAYGDTHAQGGKIYKTTDGGLSWATQYEGYAIYDICSSDGNTAWAAGGDAGSLRVEQGVVLKTNNGIDWVQQPTGYLRLQFCISSPDPWVAWTGGLFSSALNRTTAGGWGWGPVETAVTGKILGLSSSLSTEAWACGEEGFVARANLDGSYRVWKTGIPATLRSITVLGSGQAVVVGDEGAIFCSDDGGASWVSRASGVSTTLQSVKSTGDVLWAVGDNGVVIRSADGGETWGLQDSGTTANLMDVSVLDGSNAWLVGASGTVLKTMDGGGTWQPVETGLTGTDYYSVSSDDANNIWVAGGTQEQSVITKTSDGGSTWVSCDPGHGNPITSISAVDGTTAWCAVNSTCVLKTIDGGVSWREQCVPDGSGNALRVFAVDDMNAWALADWFIATSNGGYGLPRIDSVTPESVYAGDELVINGCDFGEVQGDAYVMFGSLEAAGYTSWSNSEIHAIVPEGAVSSKVYVVTSMGTNPVAPSVNVIPVRLTVTAVIPGYGSQYTVAHLTLTGTGFDYGVTPTVTLELSGMVKEASKVVVVSDNTITCDVDLSGLNLGAWDLVVRNYGKEARLAAGFTVNAPFSCGTGASGTMLLLGSTLGLLSLGRIGIRRRRRKA